MMTWLSSHGKGIASMMGQLYKAVGHQHTQENSISTEQIAKRQGDVVVHMGYYGPMDGCM